MPKKINWAESAAILIPANPRFHDLRGTKFGRLAPAELLAMPNGPIQTSHPVWRCQCDCGRKAAVRSDHLKSGQQVSCGCYQNEIRPHGNRIHGDSRPVGKYSQAPEYSVWMAMRKRCLNPKDRRWARYGGRGIKVCERWLSGDGALTGYQCFLSDMQRRPSDLHQLDREKVDGNYEPSNCRWVLPKVQQRNRSTNHIVQFAGLSMSLAEACERAGVRYNLVRDRLERGWKFDRAISEPRHFRGYAQ